MSIERKLTDLTITVSEGPHGLQVHLRRRVCESNLAGGRIVFENDRYEHMSRAEAFDVVAMIMDGELPGDAPVPEMSLFTLS